ncbi:MAG: DEAD/DEAH box helicase [Anaerolineales bacterium]|nr:DEAD/DEAH box helicase [Anaerolineales bacterium]
MNFEQFSLDPRLNAGIKGAGYSTPTPIQQQAIPVALEGRDILGLAQTGTGKTAAFVLPILQRLTKGQLRQVRALIVAPTRELAEQINQTIVTLGKQTKLRSVTVYGGVGKMPQVDALRRGAEIVVACPGRLLDLIDAGAIDLSHVELLVLDEADRMCDMGFLPDIKRILRHLPTKRQTLFFSATMPEDIHTLAGSILREPVTVQIGIMAPVHTVAHALFPVNEGHKGKLLMALLREIPTERVLIFTRTKRRARNLAEDLQHQGYRVAALQGNMAQNRRQEAITGFRQGKYDILVATDIAARGIDVAEITHVINFDMPDTVDAYTHRIGRTGRAEQTGDAFTFTLPGDEAMVRDIEKVLGSRIERRRLTGFDYGTATVAQTQSANKPAGRRDQPRNDQRGTSSRQPAYSSRYAQPAARQQQGRRDAAAR